MRILMVGEAPNREGQKDRPLAGRGGRRLAQLFGITHPEFLERFETVNLLEQWPGRSGKGSHFDGVRARTAANDLFMSVGLGAVWVLLGKRVAKAFGFPDEEYFEWVANKNGWWIMLPHPSGVSHLWNDPKTAVLVKQVGQELIWLQEDEKATVRRRQSASKG